MFIIKSSQLVFNILHNFLHIVKTFKREWIIFLDELENSIVKYKINNYWINIRKSDRTKIHKTKFNDKRKKSNHLLLFCWHKQIIISLYVANDKCRTWPPLFDLLFHHIQPFCYWIGFFIGLLVMMNVQISVLI